MENQIDQIATTLGRLESHNAGKLPSQTMINPRENMSAIKLISRAALALSLIPDDQSPKKEKPQKDEEAHPSPSQ